MKKKLFSILMSIMLTVTFIPVNTAHAEDVTVNYLINVSEVEEYSHEYDLEASGGQYTIPQEAKDHYTGKGFEITGFEYGGNTYQVGDSFAMDIDNKNINVLYNANDPITPTVYYTVTYADGLEGTLFENEVHSDIKMVQREMYLKMKFIKFFQDLILQNLLVH